MKKTEFYIYSRREDKSLGFSRRSGYVLKNSLGLSLFIRKDPVPDSEKKNKDFKPWVITERSTGLGLVSGRTKKEALQALEDKVRPIMCKIRQQIAEFHKKTGYPPDYCVDDEMEFFDVVAGYIYEDGVFLASFEDELGARKYAKSNEVLSAYPVVTIYEVFGDDIQYLTTVSATKKSEGV